MFFMTGPHQKESNVLTNPRGWFIVSYGEERDMSLSEMCFLTAREMARMIRKKEISARECMEAHLDQIEKVNPCP